MARALAHEVHGVLLVPDELAQLDDGVDLGLGDEVRVVVQEVGGLEPEVGRGAEEAGDAGADDLGDGDAAEAVEEVDEVADVRGLEGGGEAGGDGGEGLARALHDRA